MKIKNRPERYLKRSDLPTQSEPEKKSLATRHKPKKRDLRDAHIDGNFYFQFERR